MRVPQGIRVRTSVDRLLAVGVVGALAVAAWAFGGRPSGGASNDAAPVPVGAPASSDVVVDAPASRFTGASSTTTIPTATMTTTATSTTTIAPEAEVVTIVCDSLRSDGLETRRVMFDALDMAFAEAAGSGDGRAEVASRCGTELARLEGAVAIRERMQGIDIAEEDGVHALSFSGFSCGAGTFEVTVTNDTDTPLGLHANFAMYLDGDRDDAVQSSFAPVVIWSLDPGASEVLSGGFVEVPQAQIHCSIEAQIFDADPSSADATIGPVPGDPELTGDDPSAWLPRLVEMESAARVAGDIDLVAVSEDVRSLSYDEVALAISRRDLLPMTEVIEVCERGMSQPDTDHIGFVYWERLPNGSLDGRVAAGGTRLSHGLFRRGADGQWRRLSTPRYVEALFSDDCAGVAPAT